MDTLRHFRTLFDYDQWANAETMAALRRANDPPPRSLAIMAHILAAEFVWVARLEQRPPTTPVWPELPLDLAAAKIAELKAHWQHYLDTQTAEGLGRLLTYTNSKGEPFSNTPESILTHVVMHSAYHRGQIASGLGAAGHAAAATDYIHWERQRSDK